MWFWVANPAKETSDQLTPHSKSGTKKHRYTQGNGGLQYRRLLSELDKGPR